MKLKEVQLFSFQAHRTIMIWKTYIHGSDLTSFPWFLMHYFFSQWFKMQMSFLSKGKQKKSNTRWQFNHTCLLVFISNITASFMFSLRGEMHVFQIVGVVCFLYAHRSRFHGTQETYRLQQMHFFLPIKTWTKQRMYLGNHRGSWYIFIINLCHKSTQFPRSQGNYKNAQGKTWSLLMSLPITQKSTPTPSSPKKSACMFKSVHRVNQQPKKNFFKTVFILFVKDLWGCSLWCIYCPKLHNKLSFTGFKKWHLLGGYFTRLQVCPYV